ncbi:hypothetical protein [Bradymonas sediminis]|uniref:hypothetical protein n=1 Tax=Bradymonas sediminis TaxID=1548548 RepID=UPI00105EB3E1|nr:hypothetical protein [Bradymonas sediminis]TDP61770.1 ATP-dependent DNA helicase RecG [Bradymonas sediminis]
MKLAAQLRWNIRRPLLIGCLLVGLAAAGCSDDEDNSAGTNNTQADAGSDATGADGAGEDGSDGDVGEGSGFVQTNCDELQPAHCSLPWPSNQFLKPDEARATGFTLSFGAETLPASRRGTLTEPDNWRRLDGYGLGTPLLIHFEDLDISQMATEVAIADSLKEDAPVVWLEVDGDGTVLRKIPYFVEFDTRAQVQDEADRLTFIRPGVILNEGMRYVVALRGLKDTSGAAIEPSEAFVKLRDGDTDADAVLKSRQERFDDIFAVLASEGIEKQDLTLAWDFVTASSDALHGSMLSIREQGFELAGEQGPELVIKNVKENSETEHDHWWLEITGTFDSPRFMKDALIGSVPGAIFNFDEDGNHAPNGVHTQDFWLYIPHSARDASPHGLIQYGHGLLGKGSQTGGSHNGKIANDHKFIFFGTSLAGMSDEDVPRAANALSNMNAFSYLADRLHQGILEFLLLARSMRERLPTLPEITDKGIVVNADELYYSGISQGGIFGGTYMALSTDITEGHLGVPGNNYSTLLHRSVDFNGYAEVMNNAYPNPADQVVGLQAYQLLWNQTDPVSYLRHISDEPFEGMPSHNALFVPAKGDYQVSVMTNEFAARSDIGIKLMEHYGHDVDLVEAQPYPYTGSGVVLYDFGNAWPEPGNVPPAEEDGLGDPHGKPRRVDAHNEQMIHFFRSGGEIIDVCNGAPCEF